MGSESIALRVVLGQEKNDMKLAAVRERRQHSRHVAPRLTLRFEGRNYKTTDWSLGGFRISGFHRAVLRGEPLDGSVVTWFGLKREAFKAGIIRMSPEGDVCCRFLTLPKAVARTL